MVKDGLFISNSYIYEITIDYIFPKEKRMEQHSTRYVSSFTPLKIKNSYFVNKSDKNCIKTKTIELIAVPKNYFKNGLE